MVMKTCNRARVVRPAAGRYAGTVLVALLAPIWSPHSVPAADLPNSSAQVESPALVGMSAERLSRITPRMQQFVDDRQIAGAVTLVARQGRIVHLEAAGWADIEQNRPMTIDALFAVASMTKPITATAVLMLQDEGRLSVADPVSKYIAAFKDVRLDGAAPVREITIRDLLTHTSGIGQPPPAASGSDRSLAEFAEQVAKAPLRFQPGSKWEYGNGLTVCGRIIELVSGQDYAAFLRERIFAPLKMQDTTFHPGPELRNRLATMYQRGPDGKSIVAVARPLADRPRTPNPSGGLFSTAADMCRFYQMILDGGACAGQTIVSKAAVEQMTHLQTGPLVTGFTPGNGWGLGWCLVQQPQGVSGMLSPGTFGHGGAWGTQGWVDPQRQLILVLMIQRQNFGNSDGSDVRQAFQQLAVDAITP